MRIRFLRVDSRTGKVMDVRCYPVIKLRRLENCGLPAVSSKRFG